jgi:hypothetical protein
MPREQRINVRAKGDLKDRLRRTCEITGASESSLVVACVESLVSYVESHGEITLPIVVLPKSANSNHAAAQKQARIRSHKTAKTPRKRKRGRAREVTPRSKTAPRKSSR